ncbi:hypothetical protein M011DRAFT_468289 [Sporormia fimetaria CBS 119925]|uniref:Prolyl 4-hydroxylase alpha subunit Fe(2+) 2OG dioxygenase domain-containing protein n=1 Tax=Sporormia fimetaria CBS 119925 TaxID=1340428 RepID=A0A6A6VAT9_9PLEO|nr:hypothetical protein M011DRAFT_468289 [Sporormia fimetaria CBS 119925]
MDTDMDDSDVAVTTPNSTISEDDSDDSGSTTSTHDALRWRLWQCLETAKHDGTFYYLERLETYVNPGLYIHKLGQVGLPTARRDAAAMAKVSKKAPFGKGSETLVDLSVRKTFELDSSEFECQHPAWQAFLDSVVLSAAESMGVKVKMRAERYKLLLYEEGAFFKSHHDSENVPGMFGTFVKCLPSEHTGGDVHVSHGNEKILLRTSDNLKFDMSALAWYSEVHHRVEPVTSGYRAVLTFNLVQDQKLPRQTAAALDETL